MWVRPSGERMNGRISVWIGALLLAGCGRVSLSVRPGAETALQGTVAVAPFLVGDPEAQDVGRYAAEMFIDGLSAIDAQVKKDPLDIPGTRDLDRLTAAGKAAGLDGVIFGAVDYPRIPPPIGRGGRAAGRETKPVDRAGVGRVTVTAKYLDVATAEIRWASVATRERLTLRGSVRSAVERTIQALADRFSPARRK